MKKNCTFLLFFFVTLTAYARDINEVVARDTNEVVNLNSQAYANRLTDPKQTVEDATKALTLATKLSYLDGIAESYRVIGIGKYYLDQPEKAIDNYLNALAYFGRSSNLRGEAKVYNNIGVLFRDHDYDRSLVYLNKSLVIAEKIGDNKLIAASYLNIGNTYNRKNNLHQALSYYDKSYHLFSKLQDSVNLIQCLLNRGVIFYKLKDYDKALGLLLEANRGAKSRDLNESVASINLTLASLYMAQRKFDDAEKMVREGTAYTQLVKDPKLEYDYKYTTYELELNRKNFESALSSLREIYKLDSATYKTNVSVQMNLIEAKRKQEEQAKENERVADRQAYERSRFWAVSTVAGLLLVVIGLLVGNVKRKAKTNAQLTMLNGEVLRQKDNLDRINHHLEEIIDERTKDLQIKNKKLSEHSSYLSHQIRGPIATLRGLINLEKEGLVDQEECIAMMDKCVSEIDEKIIEMSDMLHGPSHNSNS
ncbi:tetratricopeptide repeat protein [Mucilaginibacter lappiensis]|uniref:Tetratricopeptide (TPR) repeat protein n=1 Tax=Mucilaginibacter lappiensis TaxID=354630 RepID=A0A1N7BLT1_9SPHI|nr:tetratricopeptide repeat protein [Mucilaginibacter lappiensis]MBB6110133.1 tetratricopeptide (TPR) repeat protein [Mucilaginibacter lappiensis]MBB6126841.1 tetratricopeptide (TPR) repeat protein [Mucilaginibacter lappiensis]SIR52163.1 Tetratricopeptide repeat-containing protein [Mucilaginibacter lappiensis]